MVADAEKFAEDVGIHPFLYCEHGDQCSHRMNYNANELKL